MTHLSLDERLALIEAEAPPDHPHLRTCVRCRAEVDEGRAALREARENEIPEPSPLFWDGLSVRVSEQVAAAPVEPRRSRWAWRVLVPSAVGIAALALAVWIERGATKPPAPAPVAATASAASAAEVAATDGGGEDESWAMLGDMAGEFDVDTLSDSLGTSSAAVDSGVYDLTAEERASLAELLRTEMGKGPATE